MDTDAASEASTSVNCDNTSSLGANEHDIFARISFNGEINGYITNESKVITRLELDVARASEKLVNLSVLLMHVAMRESEFETFASENDHLLADSVERALEIDLLAGFLDLEVNVVAGFMARIQNEIVHAREMAHSKETSIDLEEKLLDSEESLKQSYDHISEIRMQSEKLKKILSCSYEENRMFTISSGNGDKGANLRENNQLLNRNVALDMRTAEQQRHILRMLEKSLAREMDLENKLTETSHFEDELKLRLHSSEQDVYSLEEEVEDLCGRYFEAENSSEALKGISRELLGRLQTLQFSVNCSLQREAELRLKIEDSVEQLKAKESELHEFKNKNSELSNTSNLQIDDLNSKLREAEEKLTVATVKTLTLMEEVCLLEKQLEECEKIEALEKRLRESDLQLQQAVASAEASLEKQNMLYATISDMENLIRDLKLKVSKTESRADRAEENCILLSESYEELNEELMLVRSRLNCLEASLQQAECRKKASAKDIDIRTKVITNLVMQLAIERERLHKRFSSLTMENKMLTVKLQEASQNSFAVKDQRDGVETKETTVSNQEFTTTTTCAKETQVDAAQLPAASPELKKSQDNASVDGATDKLEDIESNLETTRRIDIGVLNLKHIFFVLPILVVIIAAYLSALQD